MNSDRDIYGGANGINPYPLKVENYYQNNREHSILMTIPPLGIVLLKAQYEDDKKEEIKEEPKVEKPKRGRKPKKQE